MAQTPYKVRGDFEVGDVFEVRLVDGKKAYLQYIGKDTLQIRAHVVRVFKNRHPVDSSPDIEDVVNDAVEFYAHVISVEFGMQDGTWARIGNSKNIGNPSSAFFRDPGDPDEQEGDGRWRGPKVSKTWYLWRFGDSEKVFVKQLKGKDIEAERGDAMWPRRVVERIETGQYSGLYPNYQ